ncbi:MAG TPA: basic amino acid ABC transporter substrate-binding protein [Veillonellaceae bacterium]|jgi:polar amino acid transport system substrate-binding protein|nr:basic amino acid ABC transporter substrate-binding protein [Veillonellaceae bacterium]
MKSWKKGLFLAAAAVMAAGIMTGCGGEKPAASSAASGKPVLKVATNATYVPFEFKSEDGKDYTGYEIDVVRAVAKEMGRDVEFKNIAFDGLIPALQSHDVDMTASGMTATKERAEKILFAAPFYQTKLSVVTKIDSPVQSVNDMTNGQEIAVQVGTTAAAYAKDKGMNIKNFDHSSDVIMELTTGGAAAGILDKPAADYFIATKGQGKFKVIDVPDSKVQYFAFGFNKDNKALQQEVNAAIAKLKENGTLNKIHEKWFKTPVPDMPATAEEALGI